MKKIFNLKLSLVLALVVFQLAQGQSKKATVLSAEYLKVANWTVNNYQFPLMKWENKDTLKYQIVGEFTYMSKKKWDSFLSDLELLTGMKIVEATDGSDVQITVFFGELKDYFLATKNKLPLAVDFKMSNWSNRTYNKQYQLMKTSFCIVPSKIQKYNHGTFYLKNLFLKSLGLLGVNDDSFSLFYKYSTDNNDNFSKSDKQIIKLHYDTNIKAGMNLEQEKNTVNNSIDLEALVNEKI